MDEVSFVATLLAADQSTAEILRLNLTLLCAAALATALGVAAARLRAAAATKRPLARATH
jgi:hypothetical protein